MQTPEYLATLSGEAGRLFGAAPLLGVVGILILFFLLNSRILHLQICALSLYFQSLIHQIHGKLLLALGYSLRFFVSVFENPVCLFVEFIENSAHRLTVFFGGYFHRFSRGHNMTPNDPSSATRHSGRVANLNLLVNPRRPAGFAAATC